ncbi:MAG: hypothetical protein ACREXW_14625 [Gammaproteobacteria bacterium]
MQPLAVLIPRPLHLIRFHGVLAPNARLRSDIIPNVPVNANTPSADHAAPAASGPMSGSRLLKRVFKIDIEQCRQRHLEAHRRHHPPRLPRSSPISVCPSEHRPEQQPGPSIDSNRT